MATTSETAAQPLRISASEFRKRFKAGEPATILDARSSQAWGSSHEKIRGAVRIDADHLQVNSAWPRDRFTVVY